MDIPRGAALHFALSTSVSRPFTTIQLPQLTIFRARPFTWRSNAQCRLPIVNNHHTPQQRSRRYRRRSRGHTQPYSFQLTIFRAGPFTWRSNDGLEVQRRSAARDVSSAELLRSRAPKAPAGRVAQVSADVQLEADLASSRGLRTASGAFSSRA